jgi:lysozyme family protein
VTPFEKTLATEGGYSFDENDPGGETKYGISKRSYPHEDIKNLTIEHALEIYKSDFWDKFHCDRYKYTPFAWKVFDISFNQGPGTIMAFLPQVKKPDSLAGVYELVRLQMLRYANICKNKPTQLKYIIGWTNRAFETGEDLL